MNSLDTVIRKLFGWRRIVVALDTTTAELTHRFRSAGIPSSARRIDAYRSMVLSTPELLEHVGAAILRPEDLDLRVGGGSAAEALRDAGVLVGVRADTGWEPVASPTDRVPSGLDGLRSRLTWCRDRGATLALWSVCTTATEGFPSVTVNSQAAARFARTCQSTGLVPLIRVGGRIFSEPTTDRRGALAAALLSVATHLYDLDVDVRTVVINTTREPDPKLDPHGRRVLDALPSALGGLALGSSRSPATLPRPEAVRDVADLAAECAPTWPVSLYLGREVTVPAMRAWRGRQTRIRAGHRALGSELNVASRLVRASATNDVGVGNSQSAGAAPPPGLSPPRILQAPSHREDKA